MTPLLSLALQPIAARLLTFEGCNFSTPVGEPAIAPPTSVSWRVFSNPVSVYVGGIAAVLLEFGDARVRAGVWDNSSFREDPRERMRRTGAAAMVTVFAARSEFEALASRVNAIHRQIGGETPEGQRYRADDPELLLWVHVTAAYAFLSAYTRFAEPLTAGEMDQFYVEAANAGALYGVVDPPRSQAEVMAIFKEALPRMTRSPVIQEFLHRVRTAPILQPPLRPLQRLVVRSALALLPREFRGRAGVEKEPRATAAELALVRSMARLSSRLELPTSPWAIACARLSLPRDYLERRSR